MLLSRLNTYRVEPAEARRRAELLWSSLYWPGEIEAFNTLVRRAVTARRRVHMPLQDHEIVLKYLELIPAEKAKMLEDPLRRPPMGWTYEALLTATRELVAIDRAYDSRDATGGGLPRPRQSCLGK